MIALLSCAIGRRHCHVLGEGGEPETVLEDLECVQAEVVALKSVQAGIKKVQETRDKFVGAKTSHSA